MTEPVRLGILFGGRSGEHEVSLVSARSVLDTLDPEKYQVTQIGITLDGDWLVGDDVLNALTEGKTGDLTLATMLPSLCEQVRVPIFIVQHMPPTFTESLAKSLNAKCNYTVKEGVDGDVVRELHAYVAPGGKHMLVRKKPGTVRIVVNDQPPERGCKPSVDVLFRSAAAVYREKALGLVLTGMGVDGTQGAAVLKRAGALVIAQDSETSVVWGMPRSVVASGNVDRVVALDAIPRTVAAIVAKSNQE